jgi:hypothetical protein
MTYTAANAATTLHTGAVEDAVSFFMFVDRDGDVSRQNKNPPPSAGDGFGKFTL